jgi:hypothetical protein
VNTIDDLRAALDHPSTSAVPDTATIIAAGRRQRARRRTLAGTSVGMVAAVAALAVAAGTSPTGGPTGGKNPPGNAAAGSDPAGVAPNPVLVAAVTSTGTQAVRVPERFDPLARTLHIGWLPEHLKGQSAEITPGKQMFGAFDTTYVNGGPDVGLVVTVLAKGRPLTDLSGGALGMPLDAVAIPTEPINGRPAECLSDPQVPASCSALQWQYAPGAWARVSYAGSAGKTPAAAATVARKVAESVSLTAGEPVRLPFKLDGRLARLHPARSFVRVYEPGTTGILGERWNASIDLVDKVSDLQESQPGLLRSVSVDVTQRPDDASGRVEKDDLFRPNTTIDGHQAWQQQDGRALVVWGASNCRIAVEYRNRPGDAKATYADLRLLPKPDNPADWVLVR